RRLRRTRSEPGARAPASLHMGSSGLLSPSWTAGGPFKGNLAAGWAFEERRAWARHSSKLWPFTDLRPLGADESRAGGERQAEQDSDGDDAPVEGAFESLSERHD